MHDLPVTPPYPFSAVVGLDDLRLALVLNAVSPAIGGVLARGEKGTAKSTVVRALHALLPAVAAVPGCRFSCDPAAPDPGCPDGPHATHAGTQIRPARLVELPVGATEDRLVGALDLERALTEGVQAYQPGLLAAAHRGVLYVDEVNLLPDHLVDVLLDAAGMGRAYVERDGVSVQHASRFLLVGTMNPEEGELRPQLLDRFGLTVEVRASRDPEIRAEVVRRRLAYEASPDAFAEQWMPSDAEFADRIGAARQRLPDVKLTDSALRRIAAVCAAFEVDGLRADLVTARAAVTLAAWHDRTAVADDDIRRAVELALPHRSRRNPFDEPGLDADELDRALAEADQREQDRADGTRPERSAEDDGRNDEGPKDDGPKDNGPHDDGPHDEGPHDGSPDDGSPDDDGPDDDGPDDGPDDDGPPPTGRQRDRWDGATTHRSEPPGTGAAQQAPVAASQPA